MLARKKYAHCWNFWIWRMNICDQANQAEHRSIHAYAVFYMRFCMPIGSSFANGFTRIYAQICANAKSKYNSFNYLWSMTKCSCVAYSTSTHTHDTCHKTILGDIFFTMATRISIFMWISIEHRFIGIGRTTMNKTLFWARRRRMVKCKANVAIIGNCSKLAKQVWLKPHHMHIHIHTCTPQ